MERKRRWFLWGAYLAVLTTLLVVPGGRLPERDMEVGAKFVVDKSLHVAAYSVLAILSGWLHVAAHFRWLLIYLLMGHASVTEIIQDNVPGRTGTLRDVGLNQVGVTIGILLTWRWWVKSDEPPSVVQETTPGVPGES